MVFSGIVKRKALGRGVCLMLVLGLIAGCAGVPQTGPANASRTYAPPLQSGPPMGRGRAVDRQQSLTARSGPSWSSAAMGRTRPVPMTMPLRSYGLRPGDRQAIMEEQKKMYAAAASDENAAESRGRAPQRPVGKEGPIPEAQQLLDAQKDLSGMQITTAIGGAIVGTVLGGALGALAGLASGDSRNVAKSALIGAGAGLAAGLAAGIIVADKKKDYAVNEDHLDNCINRAKQFNEIAAKANDELSTQIRLTEQNMDQLRTRVNDASVQREQISRDLTGLEEIRETTDRAIGVLDEEVSAQEKALKEASNDKSGRAAALEEELGKMRRQLAEMKVRRDRLNDLNTALGKMAV